jgi:hypothetical protein
MSALNGLLGSGPGIPECKRLGADISVHWWPTNAAPGSPCFCGERIRDDDSPEPTTATGES